MPTGKNWFHFIYINLGFISQVFLMYYFTALLEIEKNWPQYRCNPLYLPLSKNISEDFTYCVQNTQINLMGYILQPFTYLLSSITSVGGELSSNIDGIRNFISYIRNFITSIIENIFGVFQNLVIEFQMIIIALKDMIGKTIGIMVTLLYIMDGSNKTLLSAWNGPPGQMVRSLGGASCFYPSTKCKLQNGKVYAMKDLPLGSILENGSKLLAVMQIHNGNKEELYKIPGGIDNEDIYVTGSHYIFDKVSCTFIPVSNFTEAIPQTEVFSDWFSCLITSNNKISIGKHLFWDWEDDILTK